MSYCSNGENKFIHNTRLVLLVQHKIGSKKNYLKDKIEWTYYHSSAYTFYISTSPRIVHIPVNHGQAKQITNSSKHE